METVSGFCFIVCHFHPHMMMMMMSMMMTMIMNTNCQLVPGTYDIEVVPIEGVQFTRVENLVLGNQKPVGNLLLSPIAQTIRGQVKVSNDDRQ